MRATAFIDYFSDLCGAAKRRADAMREAQAKAQAQAKARGRR